MLAVILKVQSFYFTNRQIFVKICYLLLIRQATPATCLAAARSRSGSDSHSGCHSTPSRRCATRKGRLTYSKFFDFIYRAVLSCTSFDRAKPIPLCRGGFHIRPYREHMECSPTIQQYYNTNRQRKQVLCRYLFIAARRPRKKGEPQTVNPSPCNVK